MSSGYMGADATGTLPVQFCRKCGQALGTSWSIEGGLNFHPWCAPSYTQGVNAKTETELLARIAELEAENADLRGLLLVIGSSHPYLVPHIDAYLKARAEEGGE